MMDIASYKPRPLMAEAQTPTGEESLLESLPTITFERDAADPLNRQAAIAAAQIHADWRLQFAAVPEYWARAVQALGKQATPEQVWRYISLTLLRELHPALQIRPSKKNQVIPDLERVRNDVKAMVELAQHMHDHQVSAEKARATMRIASSTRHSIGRTKLYEIKNRYKELWQRLETDSIYTRYLYEILFNDRDMNTAATLALSDS